MDLRQILHGDARQDVLQTLAKYNVRVEELAGHDLQIGDRIYNGWTEQAFEALLLAVRSQIAELLQAQPSKTDLNAEQEITDFGEIPPCPYQGLSAFQEEHAEFFFGREAFIEDVVRDDGSVRQGLVNAVKTKPLVAVVGASGSGKSSLVFAGLLPQLAQGADWLICKLRPGYPDKRSFHNLAAALLSLRATEPNADSLVLLNQRAEALREGTVTLQDVVAEMLRQTPTTRCLLLVIDQFEELFTLCAEEERQPLLDVLLAGVKDVPGLKIVLTLRADFCGQAYAYRPLADALHQADLKLGPMNREELRSAIAQPAAKVGVQLEAGLVDRILDDVGQEPGNLPLLEFALTQLWAKQRQGQLTHEAYLEIGGVARALANHAEDIYERLSEEQQKQAQRIFLQLVQSRKGVGDTRRVATRTEVGNWHLVTFLAGEEARLVVTGRNDQNEETVEVVHEALIRQWLRLRLWINEDEKKLKQKAEIEAGADKWVMEKKISGHLLHGLPLVNAQAFRKEQAGKLTIHDFLDVLKRKKAFKDLEALRMERAGKLALSAQADAFIRRSLKYRRSSNWSSRLETVGLLIILAVAIFVVVETYLRKEEQQKNQLRLDQANRNRIQALNTIRSRSGEWRKALDVLDLECRIIKQLTKSSQGCKDLSYMDLSKLDLSSVNFSQANFKGANLAATNLSNTGLTDANFKGANLKDASLSGAIFSGADFSRADLRNANLIGVDLEANFLNANLAQANIKNANFKKISSYRIEQSTPSRGSEDGRDGYGLIAVEPTLFEGANLSGANLSEATFDPVQALTPEQVKTAQNWNRATYTTDKEEKTFCKKLGLKQCRTDDREDY